MKDIGVKVLIVLMIAFALMLFIFSPSAAQDVVERDSGSSLYLSQ
jgi:hypothetical protein